MLKPNTLPALSVATHINCTLSDPVPIAVKLKVSGVLTHHIESPFALADLKFTTLIFSMYNSIWLAEISLQFKREITFPKGSLIKFGSAER